MNIRSLFVPRRQEQDVPEKWELLYSENEGGSYYRGTYASYPFTPRRVEDVPAGAMESLSDICGIEDLQQVFIIPWAVRSTGTRNQRVISPNSVLALGTRALGLWTEKPEPGVKVSIQLEEIAAIEDVTILLYGRLSFVPFGERLRIRYNTVARDKLDPALLALRKRLVGPAQPIPAAYDEAQELDFKWNNILHGARTRLGEVDPVAFRFACVPGLSRRAPSRGQLLVLNPYELLYLCDPVAAPGNYGEDSFILPRSRITDVRPQGGNLEVDANGAHFSLSMAPALSEAAVRWLG